MVTILELRPNPNSKSNGIDKYCQSLRKLFIGDDKINILPVENFQMKKQRVLKEYYNRKILYKLLTNESIDIVHINGFASFSVIQAFWYAKKAKKRIIYTPHWHPFEYLNHPFRSKLFFNYLLKPLVKKYASAVVTINNDDTAFFKKFHKNVHQIPHWVNESENPICNDIVKDPSMILFVGRVNDPNKGMEHLTFLPEGKYEIHCVGPCNGGLRGDMTSHCDITFEELCKLYAKASLLVVPSRYEAFSYVTLEALSFNTPVLLSDRVRIADYLKDVDGVSTFEYHNYTDFVNKVAGSIGVKVNNNYILRQFSAENAKVKYEDLFVCN